jgi:hypothetical protein
VKKNEVAQNLTNLGVTDFSLLERAMYAVSSESAEGADRPQFYLFFKYNITFCAFKYDELAFCHPVRIGRLFFEIKKPFATQLRRAGASVCS